MTVLHFEYKLVQKVVLLTLNNGPSKWMVDNKDPAMQHSTPNLPTWTVVNCQARITIFYAAQIQHTGQHSLCTDYAIGCKIRSEHYSRCKTAPFSKTSSLPLEPTQPTQWVLEQLFPCHCINTMFRKFTTWQLKKVWLFHPAEVLVMPVSTNPPASVSKVVHTVTWTKWINNFVVHRHLRLTTNCL
jgi:hypothetical protein